MNITGQRRERRSIQGLFGVNPHLPVPCRGPLEAQLEELKERLLKPFLEQVKDTGLAGELTWAANEAAALAWYSGYPILVFPALLEEKIGAAWKHWVKQRALWGCLAA